jgi:hypothetical protein
VSGGRNLASRAPRGSPCAGRMFSSTRDLFPAPASRSIRLSQEKRTPPVLNGKSCGFGVGWNEMDCIRPRSFPPVRARKMAFPARKLWFVKKKFNPSIDCSFRLVQPHLDLSASETAWKRASSTLQIILFHRERQRDLTREHEVATSGDGWN